MNQGKRKISNIRNFPYVLNPRIPFYDDKDVHIDMVFLIQAAQFIYMLDIYLAPQTLESSVTFERINMIHCQSDAQYPFHKEYTVREIVVHNVVLETLALLTSMVFTCLV